MDKQWATMKSAYAELAKKVTVFQKKKKNKEWISPTTWTKIKES